MFALNIIKRLLQDTRGATAVEYGLIVALIVIGMVVALQGFANSTIAMWNNVEESMNEAAESRDG